MNAVNHYALTQVAVPPAPASVGVFLATVQHLQTRPKPTQAPVFDGLAWSFTSESTGAKAAKAWSRQPGGPVNRASGFAAHMARFGGTHALHARSAEAHDMTS